MSADCIAALARDNDALRDRVFVLEQALGQHLSFPPAWRLTLFEQKLLGVLLGARLMTRAHAFDVLYGMRPDTEQPHEKVIDILLAHLRRKFFRPNGIVVLMQHGVGWGLTPADKKRVLALIRSAWRAFNEDVEARIEHLLEPARCRPLRGGAPPVQRDDARPIRDGAIHGGRANAESTSGPMSRPGSTHHKRSWETTA